jgi:hypothetical protein
MTTKKMIVLAVDTRTARRPSMRDPRDDLDGSA